MLWYTSKENHQLFFEYLGTQTKKITKKMVPGTIWYHILLFWYNMIQTDTNWYKLIQTDTNWYKLIQTVYQQHFLSTLVPNLSRITIKMVLVSFVIFYSLSIRYDTNWYKGIQTVYQQLFLSTLIPNLRRITIKMVSGTILYQILFLFSWL